MATTGRQADRFKMMSGEGVRKGNQGRKNVRSMARRSSAMSQTSVSRGGGLKGPKRFKA